MWLSGIQRILAQEMLESARDAMQAGPREGMASDGAGCAQESFERMANTQRSTACAACLHGSHTDQPKAPTAVDWSTLDQTSISLHMKCISKL